MTPEERAGFAAALCPGFRATAPVHARKSELLAGELDGAPVIAKRLVRPNAVWEWYLAREIAVYRAFVATPPPIRVPRLIAASEDLLVIERLPGSAIAKRRRPHAELAPKTVLALIAAHDRFATWTGQFSGVQPTGAVRGQLRQRLLEDPSAPIEWVRDGIARSCERGIFGAETQHRALAALAAHAPIAPSHGDLLLRNAFLDGEVVLVDWECAGPHVADWDLALLWSQLAVSGRELVEAAIGGGPRRRAFLALVVFALAREVVFLEAFRAGPEHRGMLRVREELVEAEARLAGA
jgi:hypothetical protein